MLIPIIKDFNNAFSYLISNSVEKTKEVFDPVLKGFTDASKNQLEGLSTLNDILKIVWTTIQIGFSFLVQTIQYIVSFQWLRDFAYLPISIPNNMLHSSENNHFLQNFNNTIVSLVTDRQNVLQRFLFSNQSIAKPETGLAISDQSLPYNNFILGLPNVSHWGAPINSWSLSFLSNKWFDPLTVPVNFLSGSKNISQLSSLPEQITGDLSIRNMVLMLFLICLATGFSSFFNSFFISFPLSLSNLLSLRYLIIQKFWAGCVSILGIVCGEISFMLLLILPPPFIQITLVYLESVWPYILGLSLTVFIIFDLISNPYTNTMSLYQANNQISSSTSASSLTIPASKKEKSFQFLPVKLKSHAIKIFGFSFLLALTEQSCYFSFFGSLNLSSTGNFLDTYLFAASRSPIILLFSCLGFLTGSFLAIMIYNLLIAKGIFLVASLSIKIKQYNPNFIRNWILNSQASPINFFQPKRWANRQTNLRSSMDPSKDEKNNWVLVFQIYKTIKNSIMSRLSYLLFSIKSKNGLKSLWQNLKKLLQLVINYLPGGKRITFFLFPGQAYSYQSDLPNQSLKQNFNNVTDSRLTPTSDYQSFPVGFKTSQRSDTSFGGGSTTRSTILNLETQVENLLRSDGRPVINSPSLTSPSSRDTAVFTNQTLSGNTSSLGGSAFYNKIDKVLLTCLITLSFTTIPYYSFDYLINSFFGFIPQEQILNSHSLRVNFPDYTNLLGITLSDNNSVINTDVSLYDRAHFMYGEWPNSFESLNYQGELMWTNLRDHRRQKRTRRSTRLKFKTLKTKISTSWKEFKRSSGFSGSNSDSLVNLENNFTDNPKQRIFSNQKQEYANPGRDGFKTSSQDILLSQQAGDYSKGSTAAGLSNYQIDKKNGVDEKNRSKLQQKSLRNTTNLSNLFYKIFFASPFQPIRGKESINVENSTFPIENSNGEFFSSIRKKDSNQESLTRKDGPKNVESPLKNQIPFKNGMPKIPEEIRRSTSLSETIKPLSTSTFIDLSGGEKYIKTYPKNWKRVITEKYYQNPIYQSVLSTDLKNFLKREPLTQQVTNNQENELYFLRVKMAHYYDSLRFYFNLKETINNTRPKIDGALKLWSEKTTKKSKTLVETDNLSSNNNKRNPRLAEKIYTDKRKPAFQEISARTNMEPVITGTETSPPAYPPFQFKSMTSMNYRQQFKGTLKTVKQLFAISLPPSISVLSNLPSEQNPTQFSNKNDDLVFKESNQSINRLAKPSGTEPIEKSYKYDKYLFNEYKYPKNFFLHEEGRGLTNRKSIISSLHELPSQNNLSSATGKKENVSLSEPSASRGYRGTSSKNIYNMFGSNDPFYVGWDQNLRKFVLTSRILSRSSALNYNATTSEFDLNQNKKQKPELFNHENSRVSSGISDWKNSIKNNNTKEPSSISNVPAYSSKDLKRLEEKKRDSKQPSVHLYRSYTSWPFFKHQLKNLSNRPYFVLYENYFNILNKRIHVFRNINTNDIDTKSLTFLYSYSFNNNVKKYVSQLPINLYKQSMRPSSLENLFTPISNARSSFLWPGSIMPAWEYYFW